MPMRSAAGTRIARVSGLLAVAFWVASAGGDEPSRRSSNLEMVRGVAKRAIEAMFVNIVVPGRRVEVSIEPYHETAWLVQDLVGEALRARGIEVVEASLLATPAPPDTGRQAGSSPAPGDTTHAAASDSSHPAPHDTSGAKASGGSATGGSASGGSPPGGSQSVGSPGGSQSQSVGSQTSGGSSSNAPPGGGSAGGSFLESVAAAQRKAAAAGDVPAPINLPAASPAPSGPAVDAHLEVRVVELGLRYPAVHRGHLFFGGRTVERFASARLHSELRLHGDSAVRWSGEGEASVTDEVPASQLSTLEGLKYPFSEPKLPGGSGTRIIEPIIVSVIVVGLVLLFVSNRS